MAENSKILLGLPNLPADTIDPKMWSEILTIYRAIQNLLSGVSRYTGIDPPDLIERNSMNSYDYLSGSNAGQYYPGASVPITRGQIVSPIASSAVRLAQATSAAFYGIGVADETKASGNIRILVSGVTDAISGMVPGTLYYLSTTPGAIQNLRPNVAGQIVQPLGFAIDANHMLLNPSSYFQQL